MKILLVIPLICSYSVLQAQTNSYSDFIQGDTSIHWAVEADNFIYFAPRPGGQSIKKFYLQGLSTGSVRSYKFNADKRTVSPIELKTGDMPVPEWLKGHIPQLTTFGNRQPGLYFTPFSGSYSDYRIFGYTDAACCGCDTTDAMRVRQILFYKSNKFYLFNAFISPLCARLLSDNTGAWYPISNVAFNIQYEELKEKNKKDILLLGEQRVVYDIINDQNNGSTLLKNVSGSLMQQLFQDIQLGKVKVYDAKDGTPVPGAQIQTWGMSTDTTMVTDSLGNATYKAIIRQRTSEDIPQIRIHQDLYFDFKNEKLYSVIKKVELMQAVRTNYGDLIGFATVFIIE